jgi:hypothetical protein|tara:strand:- start:543 stop:827 length:285 start_codon:yes stop_codon:yes gene_type:complete
MRKEFILGIYLVVEAIYFFVTTMDLSRNDINNNFVPIWIICILINSYLLYLTLPHLKINIKSKSTLAKTIITVVILLIGALITNGPIELLGEIN